MDDAEQRHAGAAGFDILVAVGDLLLFIGRPPQRLERVVGMRFVMNVHFLVHVLFASGFG